MTRRPPARAAFTLIELLVVIAIIAILMSLVAPAVQKIRGIGPRTKAVAEISQLATACTAFNQKFKFNPPTTFHVPATLQTVNTTHVDYPGTQVFKQMFPRWMSGQADGTNTAMARAGTTLTGSACLVYFLGGPSGTGWAVDAPVAPSPNATSKIEPFFDFVQTRIAPTGEYLDPWGTPFVYHGSVTGSGAYPNVAVGGVFPFNTGPGRWVNTKGVQIVSAGENKVFGPGGTWTAGVGVYGSNQPGGDDLSNFHEKPLGAQ